MLKVAFLCSGNICRSPMAERIFLEMARRRGVPSIALSMGLLDINGRPAARNAVEACKQIGVDLSSHMSQGILPAVLLQASHVFVMEEMHVEELALIDRSVADRAQLLGGWDPEGGAAEIEDPVNQPLDAFLVCRDRLIRCIDAFLTATVPQ